MAKFYAAYGSNLNLNQMRGRCAGAKVVGTAIIEGFELLFKGGGWGSYLTVEPKEGSAVPAGIWSITDEDEEELDMYEGYPDFYYKTNMRLDVKRPDGIYEKLDCIIYIMHEYMALGRPSAGYMKTCLEGYESFGFDVRLLDEAIARSGIGTSDRQFGGEIY